ncbi:MAG: T9SS type A sorting domain-containing protein, partial [Flavobacteriales bacterium]
QAITEADGGMVAGVIWRNNGRQDQTNVSIVIEVLDETGTTVLNTTNIDPFTMPAPANEEICPAPILDTLFISTGFVPAEMGIYQVRASITSDEGDDVPDNNSKTRVIEYTSDEYGHNDAPLSTGELRGRASTDNPDLFVPYGVGNIFTFPNAGSTAYGLTVEFGPNCDGGLNFLAALYTDQSTTSQAYQLESFAYHTLYDQWIDAGPIYFPFDDAISMSTEEVYMVTVETEEETIEECTVRVEPNSDNDNSTAKKDFNSNQQLVWFFRNSYSPAVRLITSERVMSVEENSLNQASELNIYPNPASTEARIDFNLAEAGNVAYEVRDINGKLIKFDNVGKYNVGNNTFTVDVNAIATGSYFMSVVSGGKVIAHKQFIVKH